MSEQNAGGPAATSRPADAAATTATGTATTTATTTARGTVTGTAGMASAATGSGARRGGLLRRHRDFRLLWFGETTGKFGASVTSVTMPLIAVSTLHATTFQVGLLTVAAWLPWLLIGLPAGAWVDRLPRRSIMIVANGVSLVLFVSVPVSGRLGWLTIGQLLTVALLAGAAAVFFQTAYTAYLASLLRPADQPEGNAALHGSASAAQIVGLGSGGVIAQVAGAVNGMFANAATFLVSTLCLSRIRHREARPSRAERAGAALVREVREGLALLAGDRWLRTFALFGAVSNLALMGYQSINVVFLSRTVGLSSGAVGGVIALSSAGGVVGAFVARRVADRIGTARATLLFELCVPVLALLIPLTRRGAGLVFYLVGGFAVAGGVVAGNVIKASFQQRYCPPALLGRLTASTAFLGYGAIPLGALLGGTLGATLGLRPAMWITTAGVPLAALILFFSPVRRYRDLPASRASVQDTQNKPGKPGRPGTLQTAGSQDRQDRQDRQERQEREAPQDVGRRGQLGLTGPAESARRPARADTPESAVAVADA